MVWVIDQWLDGAWCVKFGLHGPMYFNRKCEAQIALRTLPKGRYRIRSVRD